MRSPGSLIFFEDLVEQQTSLTAAMESHSQLEESQYLLYLLGVLGGRDFSENRRTEIQYAAFPLEPLRPARLVFRFDDTIHFVETYLPKQQWSIKSALRQEFAAMCGAQDGFGAAVDLQNGQGIAAVAAFGPDADCACILDAIREGCAQLRAVALLRHQQRGLCGRRSAPCLPGGERQLPVPPLPRQFHHYAGICGRHPQPAHASLLYGRGRYSSSSQGVQLPGHLPRVGRFFADITRAATLPSYKLAYFDMLSRLNKLIPECAENKADHAGKTCWTCCMKNCYESTEVLQQDLLQILYPAGRYPVRAALGAAERRPAGHDFMTMWRKIMPRPRFRFSSIAESLRFSPSYLTRYFKEKTGISLMQYIDRKRFEESKRLLAATAFAR